MSQRSVESNLQATTHELIIARENVKEARNKERVTCARFTVALEREREERQKASLKYTSEIMELKRNSEQYAVELNLERQARAKDTKDWEIIVDKLELEVCTLRETLEYQTQLVNVILYHLELK